MGITRNISLLVQDKAHLWSVLNQVTQHYYVNEIARTALRATAFTGTVRNVGSGQTYTTISAAISASVDGDIIQLADGIYNTTAESGGYLFLNCPTKALNIVGNIAFPNNVKLGRFGSTGFMVRGYASKEIKFTGITFDTDSDVTQLYIDADAANRIFCFRKCIFSHSGTGVSSLLLQGSNAAYSTAYALYQFDECVFNKTVNTNRLLNFNYQGINTQLLFKSCTFYDILDINDGNEMKTAIYDCTFYISESAVTAKFGTDTTVPTKVMGLIDIRNNDFNYEIGKAEHVILLGRSTKNHYIVNNRLVLGSSSNNLDIGIVVKSIPDSIDNSAIAGNIITAPRPFLIKGGKNIKVKYNTMICNSSDAKEGFAFDNVALLPVTGCDIEFNNIFGKGTVLSLSYSETPTTTESVQSCTVDNNNYYSTNGDWANNGTVHQLATRETLWTGNASNDDNSKMATKNTYEISAIKKDL